MKALGLFPLLAASAVLAADTMVTQTNKPRPALKINAPFAEFRLKENTVFYRNDTGIYSNNVVVTDPPAKPGDPPTIMRCRELTAKRTADGKLDSIVARYDVEIDQGDNHARGQQAVYTATNEWMVLTGAFPPHPLPILYSPQGTTEGTAIIYDRANNKLFVTNATTLLPSATLQKADQKRTNSVEKNTNSPMLYDKLLPRRTQSPGAPK